MRPSHYDCTFRHRMGTFSEKSEGNRFRVGKNGKDG